MVPVTAMPCVWVISKEDPRDPVLSVTLSSLINWAGSSCSSMGQSWSNFLSISFKYKVRKAFSWWLLCNRLFALGCELSAGAWWCFRDLLSCCCLNKIFTFAQLSKPILSLSYAGLQKDFMEKYSYIFSGLSQFPSITSVASFLLCNPKHRTSTSC